MDIYIRIWSKSFEYIFVYITLIIFNFFHLIKYTYVSRHKILAINEYLYIYKSISK